MPISFEPSAIPAAMECSEFASRDAAILRTSVSFRPASGMISVTPNRPSVRVPVLSKTTAWMSLALSKADLSRINRPDFAASEVETATTRGTASPRAWGQDMTITVTALSMAKAESLLKLSQAANVIAPTLRDIMVSHRAALSARS